MARTARKMSESGYFHVIIRGNGQQQIFEENDDYKYFLVLLEKFTRETGVAVCAYCLMGNHVHLLLKDTADELSLFMKKLEVSYASFFNWKYGRTGHLFQGRYKSEPIDDDSYLLRVFRYILRNPAKAGIASPEGYPWSSYRYYDGGSFVDTLLIGEMLGSRENYEDFVQNDDDGDIEEFEDVRISDADAKRIIREKLGIEIGSVIQSFSRAERDAAVIELLTEGLSERQIARLTGISRYIIRRIDW